MRSIVERLGIKPVGGRRRLLIAGRAPRSQILDKPLPGMENTVIPLWFSQTSLSPLHFQKDRITEVCGVVGVTESGGVEARQNLVLVGSELKLEMSHAMKAGPTLWGTPVVTIVACCYFAIASPSHFTGPCQGHLICK